MFYSNQILARKGPLGLVWIAAHMDRQLKRQQINSTSIPASVDTLLDPEVPLALRLSGQLLLGVVRIYARKVSYLQQDCDAALVKIAVSLRPADGSHDTRSAPLQAITILDPAAAAAVAARARKAQAAKAAADGKNNAAAGRQAGGAAAVDGWLGPVDEDGFMLGLDDVVWDEEALLLDSTDPGLGLGTGLAFEPRSRLSFGLAPSGSGLNSHDISGVFGMYSSQDEVQETFDVEDEEAAAVWDLDELEVERLRAAPSQSQPDSIGGLSGLVGGDTPAGGAGGTVKATGALQDTPGDLGDLRDTPLGADGFTPGSLASLPPAADTAGGDDDDQHDAAQQQQEVGGAAADLLADMDLDGALDLAAALPPTPQGGGGEEGGDEAAQGGEAGGEGVVADPYDLDDVADLGALLPPTPAAEESVEGQEAAEAAASVAAAAADSQQEQQDQQQQQQGDDAMDVDEPAAAAGGGGHGTPTKTFQRKNTRQSTRQQQQQEKEDTAAAAAAAAEGAAADDAGAPNARPAPMTAAKSARQRRVSVGLLGIKRRVMVDGAEDEEAADGGGGGGRGTAAVGRHAPTELPAAEIRALLADRAPLLDLERVHKVSKHLQQQAASSLTAQGAAALAQQQLLLITAGTAAARPAAADSTITAAAITTAAATTASLPAEGGAAVAVAAATAFVPGEGSPAEAPRLVAGLPCLGVSLSASFAGGLGLPTELQQLFTAAAAAPAPAPATAAAAADGAEGVAEGEVAGLAAGEDEEAAAAGGASAAGYAPVASLEEIGGLGGELEEVEGLEGDDGGVLNPGLAGGGTRCSLSLSLTRTPGTEAAAAAGGGQGVGDTPGTVEGAAAAAGYPPGSAGYTPGGEGYTPGTAGFSQDSHLNPTQDLQQAAGGLGETADVLQPLDDVNLGMDDVNPEGQPHWVSGEGSDKENSQGVAGAAASAGKGPAAAGMVWPADMETLLEQEGADQEVTDGGFTSRTRLVVKHLQHAAATAAAGSSGFTPLVGNKRRISAAAAGMGATPLGAAAAAGKEGGAAAASAAAMGPSLSFDGITAGHSRMDACRWFYEVLVLSNKGLVKLQQDESYGDITVTPNLAAMARV